MLNAMKNNAPELSPGPIVLFGSGETSPSGQKTFDALFRRLAPSPRVSMLETPAGFEPNSDSVIGRVADFISHNLQNYNPRIDIVPARNRATEHSPDNPDIVEPLLQADVIFMGPGSPSYAVRQLEDSLAWQYVLSRHYLGAALALSSAATIAVGRLALPIYEIYKVGEDLHWKNGLDLFGLYGMSVVFVPHWNNNDGGKELDTSRCYIGNDRFVALMDMVPREATVLGIDEHTSLIVDMGMKQCQVVGNGGVTLLHMNHGSGSGPSKVDLKQLGLEEAAVRRDAHVHQYSAGQTFPLDEWFPIKIPDPGTGIPESVWSTVVDSSRNKLVHEVPPEAVLELVREREAARDGKDWEAADNLRDRISDAGWIVVDTLDGSELTRKE
jgi:cyanophycinase-like exopeptidase